MPAGIWNSVIEQGATWQKTFVYKNLPSGSPINITGATIRMQARDSEAAPTAIIDLSVGSGIVITDGVNGIFQVTIPAATTAGIVIPPNSSRRALVYDILVTLAATSVVLRILKGSLDLSPGVTR